MSQKPPPLFRPVESLRVVATPRLARWCFIVALAVLIPTGADTFLPPKVGALRHGPSPLPVPPLAETTEMTGWEVFPELLNTIPPPGPNQKRAGKCNPKASQVEINGGCWVKTDHERPCPDGVQWEHDDGRCYLPVAEAKPIPRAGEPTVVNVAGEP